MSKQQGSFWFTPPGWAAIGLIGAVSYFLLMEHRQHLFEFLPYLILLACPLMHLFMHQGHGHGHHGDSHHGHAHHDRRDKDVGDTNSGRKHGHDEENDDAR